MLQATFDVIALVTLKHVCIFNLFNCVKCFQLLKGMRTLNWKTNLGLVNLEIELKDRKLSLSVSPIHATIIMHFQDKG